MWNLKNPNMEKQWLPGAGRQLPGQMLFKGTNLQLVANKPQRSNAQYSEYRQQYYIIIFKVAKRLELNYFKH